jgi:outer membrane protein TolC
MKKVRVVRWVLSVLPAALLFPLSVLAGQNDGQYSGTELDDVKLGPERAVALALSGNPGLVVLKLRASALAEVPSQVGTLPDPSVSFGLLSVPTDSFSMSQEAMTQTQIGLALTLPFPGKLGLREQAANLEAESAESDVAEKRLALAKTVRQLWWNLFYLDHALHVVKQNQDLLRQFVKIAETRYKTGVGMQSDVLLAQVELSRLLDADISLVATRHAQAAALNAQLGLSAEREITLAMVAAEDLPSLPDTKFLNKLALESRPMIRSRGKLLDAASARTRLAERDYYPDLRLGAAYGIRKDAPNGSSRADLASITLNLNIPIFAGRRQDKAVSQRHLEEQKEKYNLQDAILQVDSEVAQAVADYRAACEQASLFKSGIIPQASQTTSSMLSAYQVNKVDFLNLVRSQVTLYNYQTQYWKTISAAWQSWARLESAVGVALDKSNTTANESKTNDKEMVHE